MNELSAPHRSKLGINFVYLYVFCYRFSGINSLFGVDGYDMTQTASSSSVDDRLETPIQDNRVSPTFTSNSRKRKIFYST